LNSRLTKSLPVISKEKWFNGKITHSYPAHAELTADRRRSLRLAGYLLIISTIYKISIYNNYDLCIHILGGKPWAVSEVEGRRAAAG
jgi:hypothetical protein